VFGVSEVSEDFGVWELSKVAADYVKFLHPVGASTLKYGVTIPVEAQTERMHGIAKGRKAPVTVLFGTEEPVVAEIRRLNNKPGHLQFRYENKAQERLRQYLLNVFGNSAESIGVRLS
jgi:hypothetical protein